MQKTGYYKSKMEDQVKFTEEDEKKLRQAMQFLKHRELCQEPFDGYWGDDDEDGEPRIFV